MREEGALAAGGEPRREGRSWETGSAGKDAADSQLGRSALSRAREEQRGEGGEDNPIL